MDILRKDLELKNPASPISVTPSEGVVHFLMHGYFGKLAR
jgi:hypothetical protein